MNSDTYFTKPTLDLEAGFWAMVEEFRAAGETRFDKQEGIKENDFPAYVRWLENGARGVGLKDGLVPWSAFWLVEESSGSIVGVSSLRHTLSPFLEKIGGHIGYAVRPARRCEGWGTLILALTLKEARKLGLRRVLVMCDSDNIGSARIIEKNGGQLQDEITRKEATRISRYWIELP